MEIQFSRNSGGIHRVPAISMLGWRRVADGSHGASFRPGIATLRYRLLMVALGGVLMATTHFSLMPLVENETRERPAIDAVALADTERANARMLEGLDPEVREAVEAEVTAKRQARASEAPPQAIHPDTVRSVAQGAYTVLMVLFGLVALLPMVSLAWNRVSLRRDADNRLMLHHWGIFPKRYTIPLDALCGIRLEARQHVERRPMGKHSSRPVPAGWRWRVGLVSAAGGAASAEFVLHHQHERPDERRPAPELVRLFVNSLQHLTGLPVGQIEVRESHRLNPNAPPTRRGSISTTIPLDDPAALESLPPDLRAQVEEALRGEGSIPVRHLQSRTQRVTVTDKDGRTQTYDSMDALPDAVRARLNDAHQTGRVSMNEEITVQDEAGNVHHYRSPDDMPPDIRALYEQMGGMGGQKQTKPWE